VQKLFTILCLSVVGLLSCRPSANKEEPAATETPAAPTLFTLLKPAQTGVDFSNQLTEGPNTNVLMYEYFYNGGGVAIGDLNHDGLEDVYFSANMTANQLYLNLGNMQFRDITETAGVSGRNGPWKTGVTMADVNGDGWLDIHVSYSGNLRPERLVSQLYINQGPDAAGIPRFVDQAVAYGLNHPAYSTQAFFFDYDRDGDLDMLQLNHSPQQLPPVDEAAIAEIRKDKNAMIGLRLFEHHSGKGGITQFRDVTEKAGLHSSALAFGLGVGIADVNGDGWPDIYVSNDYIAPDYLYLNRQNDTFTDQTETSLGHISHFSMGNEIADVNNDGLPDIFTLDMLPEDNRRQKLLIAPDNYEKFELNLRAGLQHQYMRNMLHLNNGVRSTSTTGKKAGTGPDLTFSEVGQMACISNTDWSWAPLFADLDNDGWKDLYVTNGYLRDYTNLDFTKYMTDFINRNRGSLRDQHILELVRSMPASDVVNYAFRNTGGDQPGHLGFTNQSAVWGIATPSNSNGAAYADLDNDGDLDLIVNNINQPAFIYRNEADHLYKRHYLKISLEGERLNTQGLGTKVIVYTGQEKQYLEQMPTRGYQSSVSPVLHIGLGSNPVIDSLQVVWLGGKRQTLRQVKADQVLHLRETEAQDLYRQPIAQPSFFREVKSPIDFQHQPAATNDFKRQPLLVSPLSFSGPCLVKADVNGDGQDDVYVGGAIGQPGSLFMGQAGQFVRKPQPAFDADLSSYDTDAAFFDANADGFPDLYVCSGGYHDFAPQDERLQDRLYLNDGKGNFTRNVAALPAMRSSSSCVRVADINDDGKPDLFVGGRVIPGHYPETPQSYLLLNEGGHFADHTRQWCSDLSGIGMITDAAWTDLNHDHQPDLILVGEWMSVMAFVNQSGKLSDQTSTYFDKAYLGWWNKLLLGDFNSDGHTDLIVGNQGLNSQCRASDAQPAELYYKDFDDNGTVDPILCLYSQGQSYPYVTRDELLDQMSTMRNRFADYRSYADARFTDIFTEQEREGAHLLKANALLTTYFEWSPEGKFRQKPLPVQCQFAPVHAMAALDYNQDGITDLILAGNSNKARLRLGKSDANYGMLLKGNGAGQFSYIEQTMSGFHLRGDVRSILEVNRTWLFGMNQGEVKAYRLK
jgi:enediyne biosynthesis protein E4